jgi:hypothetical protein
MTSVVSRIDKVGGFPELYRLTTLVYGESPSVTGITSTWTPDFFSYSAPIFSNATWISAFEFRSVIWVPRSELSYWKVSTEVSMGSSLTTSLGSSGSLAKPNVHPVNTVDNSASESPSEIRDTAFLFIAYSSSFFLRQFRGVLRRFLPRAS